MMTHNVQCCCFDVVVLFFNSGADDLEQLKELDQEEFDQLCKMVGMDKKPFHVMRLKKALDRHTSPSTSTTTAKPHPPVPDDNKTTPITPLPTPPVPAASNSPTITSSENLPISAAGPSNQPSTIEDQAMSVPGVKRLQPDRPPNKEFLDAMEKAGQGFGAIQGENTNTSSSDPVLFLPPYLQSNSESKDFKDLIDEQTPIQKTLGPCPLQPGMWDPERKELIRKYASVYGKNFSKRQKEVLTPFEEQVNEGAYQLCLRDPTLLVRREELFLLAKRAVKEGARYYHSLGKDLDGTLATTGQKRPHPTLTHARDASTSHLGLPSPKILITSDLVGAIIPKKMSGRMRQERMAELERMIAVNKTQQAAKLVELEQAQQLCNFSMAFSIQLEVESLGNACQQLQTSYAALKRKQRRSDRYYTIKERDNEQTSSSAIPVSVSAESERERGGVEGINMSQSLHAAASAAATQKRTGLFRQASGVRVSNQNTTSSDTSRKTSSANSRPTVTAMVIPKSPLTPSLAPNSTSSPAPTPTTTISAPQQLGVPMSGGLSSLDSSGEDTEVQDLVKNVSHATDEVNSIMIREFQKQLVWDL